MSYEMIKYAKADAIATITLNRPEKYNTLRMELIREMDEALKDANQDKSIKVIILEGSGDAFCGGFDFSGGLEHYARYRFRKLRSWYRLSYGNQPIHQLYPGVYGPVARFEAHHL